MFLNGRIEILFAFSYFESLVLVEIQQSEVKLHVAVYKQNFFTPRRKRIPEARARGRFSATAFVVSKTYNFGFCHFFAPRATLFFYLILCFIYFIARRLPIKTVDNRLIGQLFGIKTYRITPKKTALIILFVGINAVHLSALEPLEPFFGRADVRYDNVDVG